jgi:type VI protein secretion system component VasK
MIRPKKRPQIRKADSMTGEWATVAVGLLSLIGTLAGSYFSNRKGQALIAYRLEQLEEKVNKHNNLIERTYQLEETQKVQAEQIKVANHRIADLEQGAKK